MTMTPVHMRLHGHEALSPYVVSAHIGGMFACARWSGATSTVADRSRVQTGAIVLVAATVLASTAGISEWLLFPALWALGLGWNFGLLGGSALIESIPSVERVVVQGTADLDDVALRCGRRLRAGLHQAAVGYHVLADLAASAPAACSMPPRRRAGSTTPPDRTEGMERLSCRAGLDVYCRRGIRFERRPCAARRPTSRPSGVDEYRDHQPELPAMASMGYRTPNIDRLADEGMRFTDSYGEQSCTAGRSSFITGQELLPDWLSKVGVPGRRSGCRPRTRRSPSCSSRSATPPGSSARTTSATATSSCRRCTGSTSSSATSTTSTPRRSRNSRTIRRSKTSRTTAERYGPRGVLHCWATDDDDDTEDPRWGRGGKQRIEDTGPLNRKRMETIDDDIVAHAVDFIERQHSTGAPFFAWVNTTHMHCFTHPKPESAGQSGRWQSTYHDTMIDHDKHVGQLLDKLDAPRHRRGHDRDLQHDNGPHQNTWPDAGTTPFRSEKNTNWEGASRVPELIRWPGQILAGGVSNEIVSITTGCRRCSQPRATRSSSRTSSRAARSETPTYRVHTTATTCPYLTGETDESPLRLVIDDGDVLALRFDNWKVVFMEQRCRGTLQVWAEPFVLPGGAEAVQPAHRPA